MKLIKLTPIVVLLAIFCSPNEISAQDEDSAGEEVDYNSQPKEDDDATVDLRPFIETCIEMIDSKTLLGILDSCDVRSNISDYLQGVKFATVHHNFWTEPEFLEVFQFIAENGYPEIYDLINSIYDFLGLTFRVDMNGPTEPAASKPFPLTGRDKPECHLATLVDEIQAVVPIQQFEFILNDAVENDSNVRAFLKRMFKPSKLKAFRKFMESPDVQSLIAYLKSRDSRLEGLEEF